MDRWRTGILVFPEVEVLDFCGPFEVFAAAGRDAGRRSDEPSPFDLRLIAPSDGVLRTAGGLRVLPDATIYTCPSLDLLIVPGGRGVRACLGEQGLLAWIAEAGAEARIVASVCTGGLLLGQAGLLDGLRATTHHGSIAWMKATFPRVQVLRGPRVVDEGHVVTSAGVSAGIDLALHLVGRLLGKRVARETARQIELPYRTWEESARTRRQRTTDQARGRSSPSAPDGRGPRRISRSGP